MLIKGRLSEEEKQIIKKMRNQNIGYTEIANKLNCKKDRVKKYCQKNKLGGRQSYNQYGDLKEREEKFKKEFEEKFPNFKYYSDFKDVDSNFKYMCRKCGYIQERNAQCVRPSRNKELQCDNCNKIDSLRKELVEKLNKYYMQRIKTIEDDIQKEVESLKRIAAKHKYYIKCSECGRAIFSNKNKKTCSQACANKRKNRIKEVKRRRKLKSNGNINWNISLKQLYERDKGICYICNKKTDINDYEIRNDGTFIAGDNYPSIDHLIPVNKGGTHTWDNVRLAHRHCNIIKSDKLVKEEKYGQLKFII